MSQTTGVRPRLAALAAALALACPVSAAQPDAFDAGETGFHSVLAYGQGKGTSAVDLAQNLADGTVPDAFQSQAAMYDRVVTEQPTGTDLSAYYKDSSFAKITGDTETVGDATVVRDTTHRVPHIYGATRAGAMYAAGYVSAEDRLFLMDVLRRTSLGTSAELLGADYVDDDSAQLGQFDLSPEELTAEVLRLPQDEGAAGARALADLQQYVAGINAFIAATRTNPSLLPAEYPALGALPRDWTLADSAAEAYLLIAEFTVFGDAEDAQSDILSRLVERFGATKGKGAYDDLRDLEDPSAPVTADRPFPSDRPSTGPSSAVSLDARSIRHRDAVASTGPLPAAVPGAFPAWVERLSRHGLQLEHHASNALLVSADHSRSGRALAAMGPQLGYYSPEIVVEYELHAPGIHTSGMAFPGASPYTLIGHTGSFAWSGTTANGDNADTFAEQLCNTDGSPATLSSDAYLYKGTCTPFTHRDVTYTTPVAPTGPAPPETVTLRTMRSVHGSVHSFATSGGTPYALVRSTAVSEQAVRSITAFSLIAEGAVTSPESFVATMRHYTGNENWFYVDRDHIAWLQSGRFPQHAPGTDLELPIRGTGAWDWVGFDPATSTYTPHGPGFNPTAIDPAQGYLSSWNNKAAPQWRAAPGIWSYGRVHRDELLRDPTVAAIAAGRDLTLADVVGISGSASTQDLRGVEVLPDLLDALGTSDQTARLRAWVASGAHRRDLDGDGSYEDSAAVLVFDAWWKQLVHDVFDPQVGADVVLELQKDIDLVLDGRPVETGFYDGWYGQVSDVVRGALGRQPQPSVLRCGDGTLAGCRAVLASSLAKAVAAVGTAQGSTDPASWRKPALCPGDDTPTCDENRPKSVGAIDTPGHPFENRGTFHQAVEVGGPVPFPRNRSTAPVPTPAGPGGGLAATGGAPVVGLVGLVLLGAVALSRGGRRRRGARSPG